MNRAVIQEHHKFLSFLYEHEQIHFFFFSNRYSRFVNLHEDLY